MPTVSPSASLPLVGEAERYALLVYRLESAISVLRAAVPGTLWVSLRAHSQGLDALLATLNSGVYELSPSSPLRGAEFRPAESLMVGEFVVESNVEVETAPGVWAPAGVEVYDLPFDDVLYCRYALRVLSVPLPALALADVLGWSPASPQFETAARLIADGVPLHQAFAAAEALVS